MNRRVITAVLPLFLLHPPDGAAQADGAGYEMPVREQRDVALNRALGLSPGADAFELRSGDQWHGDLRVPLAARSMVNLGNRVDIPPRGAQDGVQWRSSVSIESTDNALAASRDRRSTSALLLVPGANWVDGGRRHRVEVDASADLLRDLDSFDHGDTLDAASLFVNAYYRLSETVGLSAFDVYFHSHEPVAQSPVTVSGRYAAQTHLPSVALDWQAGAVDELSLRWSGADNRSVRPRFTDTWRQDIDLTWRRRTDALKRFGLRARQRDVSFEQAPGRDVSALWATADVRLSQRLLGQASLGYADARGGGTVVGTASLAGAFARGQWTVSLERDITEIGGLSGLYALNRMGAEARLRVGDSAQLALGLQASHYRPREANGNAVRLLRPSLTWSQSLDRHTSLMLRYLGDYDEVPDIDYEMFRNRLRVSLMYVF
jgi:hypothetical protein